MPILPLFAFMVCFRVNFTLLPLPARMEQSSLGKVIIAESKNAPTFININICYCVRKVTPLDAAVSQIKSISASYRVRLPSALSILPSVLMPLQ